jgi:hypothetical protein
VRSTLVAVALLTGLAAGGLGLTPRAAAQEAPTGLEIRGGVLAHDVPDLIAGFNRENGVDINAEVLFGPGVLVWGGLIRPVVGGSVNTEGYTSRAYLDARWEFDLTARLFFDFGLGAAVHNGQLDPTDPDHKALGSRVLFHIPLELGYRLDAHNSISVYFEHTSNANLAPYNEGLDAIGVRYGHRF